MAETTYRRSAPLSISEFITGTSRKYLGGVDRANPPELSRAAAELLNDIADVVEGYNAVCPPDRKCKVPTVLPPAQIADILLTTRRIVNISPTGSMGSAGCPLLAIYQEDGADRGIYSTDDKIFRELARECNCQIKSNDLNEVMLMLKDRAPYVAECSDRDLVPVDNGIFDYKAKRLLPFSPDRVFLRKCRVGYVAGPVNPVLHNPDDGTDWDVESWMLELTGDPEITELLWEIAGAIVRPYVSWDKLAMLYAEKGNNGKGTFCRMLKNLCGEGNYASIPMQDFSREFLLEPLIHATAVIVDENNVGGFIEASANLKAVVTNDTVQINRKFKQPVYYRFHGFMVQCVNEMPRVRDKSDSFYRRLIPIPFPNCFTGKERKYIKDDYLGRKEVLEYILWRVLHMDYYEFSVPGACRAALAEYKATNDPVRQFWAELRDEFAWDLLPFDFLYELYKKWFQESNPSGGVEGRQNFIKNIRNAVSGDPDWAATDKPMATAQRMNGPERLICRYNVEKWKREGTTASLNRDRIASPELKGPYRGIYRKTAADAIGGC